MARVKPMAKNGPVTPKRTRQRGQGGNLKKKSC